MNKFYRSDDKKNILLNLVALDGEKEVGLESLKANTSDGAAEKHVPVVSVDGNRVEVSVYLIPCWRSTILQAFILKQKPADSLLP